MNWTPHISKAKVRRRPFGPSQSKAPEMLLKIKAPAQIRVKLIEDGIQSGKESPLNHTKLSSLAQFTPM